MDEAQTSLFDKLFDQVSKEPVARMSIVLDDLISNLAGNWEAIPSLQLINSVRTFGVREPVQLNKVDDKYYVLAGRRRIAAARQAGLKKIPVVIFDYPEHIQSIVTIEDNHINTSNLRADLTALQDLLTSKPWLLQSITQLSSLLGTSKTHLRRLLAILDLPDEILDRYAAGKISDNVLISLSKMSKNSLTHILLSANGKITADDVATAKLARRVEISEQLPWDSLIATPTAESLADVSRKLQEDEQKYAIIQMKDCFPVGVIIYASLVDAENAITDENKSNGYVIVPVIPTSLPSK